MMTWTSSAANITPYTQAQHGGLEIFERHEERKQKPL